MRRDDGRPSRGEGWHQRRREHGGNGGGNRNREDSRLERDDRPRREGSGGNLPQREDACLRNGESEPRTGERKHHAFGEELANEPATAGAERDADRQLVPPRQRTREQQAGDVGARDQQDEGGRAHQGEEPRAGGAGHSRPNRHQTRVDAAERSRDFALQCAHHAIDVVLRRTQRQGRRDAGEDPDRPHVRVSRVTRKARDVPRNDRVRALVRRHAEAWRHHADHGPLAARHLDRAADDRGVGGEATPPDAVEQHDHAARGPRFLVQAESASERGTHSQHLECVAREAGHHDLLRTDIVDENVVAGIDGGDVEKRRGPIPQGGPRGGAESRRGPKRSVLDRLQLNDRALVAVGKRSDQDRVDDAEDRRRGTDADGKGQEHDERRRRRAPECAGGDAQIRGQLLGPQRPADAAIALDVLVHGISFGAGRVPELRFCGAACGVGIHAAVDQLGGALVNPGAHLLAVVGGDVVAGSGGVEGVTHRRPSRPARA